MDYGKSAYLRVDDLAKRMADLERAKAASYGSVQFAARPGESAEPEKTYRHTVSIAADGVCQLLLRVRASSSSGGTLSVGLKFGGASVLDETAAFDPGTRDAFYMTSIRLSRGVTETALTLSGAFTIESYELIAFGYGLSAAKADIVLELGKTTVMIRDGGHVRVLSTQTGTETYGFDCDRAHLSTDGTNDYVAFTIGGAVFRTGTETFVPEPFEIFAEEVLLSDRTSGIGLTDGKMFEFCGSACESVPVPQGRVLRLTAVADDTRLIAGLNEGRLYLKTKMESKDAYSVTLGEKQA